MKKIQQVAARVVGFEGNSYINFVDGLIVHLTAGLNKAFQVEVLSYVLFIDKIHLHSYRLPFRWIAGLPANPLANTN